MELLRALGALLEPPGPEHARLAELLELGAPPSAEAYLRLFGLELSPYASVYLGAEGKLGGAARDRIAGFWRALGARPPAEPDHLAALLAAYASLREEGDDGSTDGERARHARRAFLWEHLASWLPAWLAQLDRLADPFYRGWGRLLRDALAAEWAPSEPPATLPLHLREAPELADPREAGGAALLASLLAPVRSGLLLAPSDLARAASDLGLGLRAGERAYALRFLLGQDAEATLAWLGREAAEWGARHAEAWARVAPSVGEFWAARAAATARLLDELADEAPGE